LLGIAAATLTRTLSLGGLWWKLLQIW